MSSMKKKCISVKCGSVGLLGNGYAEIEANFFLGLAKKVLMVLETLLHGGSGFHRERAACRD